MGSALVLGGCPEVALGEGVAGALLEVALEGDGLRLLVKADLGDEPPGQRSAGVAGSARIVLRQPLLEIGSTPDVARSARPLDQINIMHREGPVLRSLGEAGWWTGLDSNQRTGNPGRFTVCCL